MLACLVAAHTALASPFGLRRASQAPLRSRGTLLGLEDVRASLLAEVAAVPNRGAALNEQSPVRAAVLDLVQEIEPLDREADRWEDADALTDGRTWRLAYTSSATFHDNHGLTGYYGPAETAPALELLLRFTSAKGVSGTLEMQEQPAEGAAAAPAGLAPQIVLQGNWVCAPDGTLKVSPQTFVAGERSWAVQDRRGTDTVDFERDKAVRCLCACRPVYLDEGLFVMRGLLPSVVFVFVRP